MTIKVQKAKVKIVGHSVCGRVPSIETEANQIWVEFKNNPGIKIRIDTAKESEKMSFIIQTRVQGRKAVIEKVEDHLFNGTEIHTKISKII